jgi:hypothetical protein
MVTSLPAKPRMVVILRYQADCARPGEISLFYLQNLQKA